MEAVLLAAAVAAAIAAAARVKPELLLVPVCFAIEGLVLAGLSVGPPTAWLLFAAAVATSLGAAVAFLVWSGGESGRRSRPRASRVGSPPQAGGWTAAPAAGPAGGSCDAPRHARAEGGPVAGGTAVTARHGVV